jgi:hypothetical protein
MNPSYPKLAFMLCWSARFTALLSIGVLLLFMTGDDGLLSRNAWAKVRPTEWAQLLFFPLGVLVGLVLAWLREGLGAAVAVVSLAAFYLSHTCLTGRAPGGPWFLIFTSPALLFFASWFAHRGQSFRATEQVR